VPFTGRTLAVTGAVVAGLLVSRPVAQGDTLDEVLRRAANYVADFHRQLSGIVAEETYTQTVTGAGGGATTITRRLRSDLILLKAAGERRYVELRDVFEVDGAMVRDREARLERLIGTGSAGTSIGIRDIIAESARYNIGNIVRNINTPLMSLLFLQDNYQGRVAFSHNRGHTRVFTAPAERALNEAPVFRVATEMWTVEFEERRGPTVIRDPRGNHVRARGRFWINPASGAVLISELVVGGAVDATVTVSYQSEPLMGFLVPVEMRESYKRGRTRVEGHAVYGRFRALTERAR
jgi:hypothetical protein